MPPLIAASKYNLVNVYRDDLFLVATMVSEMPPLLVVEFLHRVVDLFHDYFGGADDTAIKENFSTVYQVVPTTYKLPMQARRKRGEGADEEGLHGGGVVVDY